MPPSSIPVLNQLSKGAMRGSGKMPSPSVKSLQENDISKVSLLLLQNTHDPPGLMNIRVTILRSWSGSLREHRSQDRKMKAPKLPTNLLRRLPSVSHPQHSLENTRFHEVEFVAAGSMMFQNLLVSMVSPPPLGLLHPQIINILRNSAPFQEPPQDRSFPSHSGQFRGESSSLSASNLPSAHRQIGIWTHSSQGPPEQGLLGGRLA